MSRLEPVTEDGSILETALGYAGKGFSVCPLQPARLDEPDSGKSPVMKWKQCQTQRATPDQIRHWFAHSQSNVGIVTGSISGLVVVDCDSDEAVEWCLSHLQRTPMATQTGGGGMHLFYRHPGVIVRNGVKLRGMDLDVRGDGGYVVAPPSLHWSGRRYVKLGDWNAELPRFDAEWIGVRKCSVPQTLTRVEDVDGVRRRARNYIARIHSISGKGGDLQLFRAACVLVQRFGLPEDIALEELRSWNMTNAEPPWTDSRLTHKINEALRLMKGE